jgi:hypothetical protein
VIVETDFVEDFIREHGRPPLQMDGARHFCQDWDFMAIDKSCEEFKCCTCFIGEKL